MWGCWSDALMRISLRNLSAPIAAANSGAQHFDGHLATVLEIFGQVYSRHAAATQFALDRVAFREGGPELMEGLGHENTRYLQANELRDYQLNVWPLGPLRHTYPATASHSRCWRPGELAG